MQTVMTNKPDPGLFINDRPSPDFLTRRIALDVLNTARRLAVLDNLRVLPHVYRDAVAAIPTLANLLEELKAVPEVQAEMRRQDAARGLRKIVAMLGGSQ